MRRCGPADTLIFVLLPLSTVREYIPLILSHPGGRHLLRQPQETNSRGKNGAENLGEGCCHNSGENGTFLVWAGTGEGARGCHVVKVGFAET